MGKKIDRAQSMGGPACVPVPAGGPGQAVTAQRLVLVGGSEAGPAVLSAWRTQIIWDSQTCHSPPKTKFQAILGKATYKCTFYLLVQLSH